MAPTSVEVKLFDANGNKVTPTPASATGDKNAYITIYVPVSPANALGDFTCTWWDDVNNNWQTSGTLLVGTPVKDAKGQNWIVKCLT